ncbi:MAG: hypothetical protein PHG27_04665 [Massilibacteroides sp.]|nr:hypothetical protein [Massilibacteroides sp.]
MKSNNDNNCMNTELTRRQFIKKSSFVSMGLISGLGVTSSIFAANKTQLTNLEHSDESTISISTFDMDATPPVGSDLAYDVMKGVWDLGLRAKGLVLTGCGYPIVLCAIDWIGIGNESYDIFREKMAEAAGTVPERVALHTLHQHDSVWCDFGAEKILRENGIDPQCFDGTFARSFLDQLCVSIRKSISETKKISHVGFGEAPVKKVASNRRIFMPDGHVEERWTACTDEKLRQEPEGIIDPILSLISFWDENRPVAVLSYYATHPQSYYRTGIANPDFPGLARFIRQAALPEALMIHFNGAGGDVGAGKYNDGSKENRLILASRLVDGMEMAWNNTDKFPLTKDFITWKVAKLTLPPAVYLSKLKEQLALDKSLYLENRDYARKMAWYSRCLAGKTIDVSCLSIGKLRVLHMPAELFVEYQLTAKSMRPDLKIVIAAYGDYGPGYICTELAMKQGGYETTDRACNVAPGSEKAIINVFAKLLS